MANLGTKAAVEGKGNFAIHTPLIHLTKAEIIAGAWRSASTTAALTPATTRPRRGSPAAAATPATAAARGLSEAGVADPVEIRDS